MNNQEIGRRGWRTADEVNEARNGAAAHRAGLADVTCPYSEGPLRVARIAGWIAADEIEACRDADAMTER